MNEQHTAAAAPPRTLYPAMRYEDVRAAIAFLTAAFGFEQQALYETPSGGVAHAQVLFGDGMIMLGEPRDGDDESGKSMTTPKRAGALTGCVYAYCADPDALHARAVRAGAEVMRAPYDTEYGSREASFRDPEGYVWTFGTYRP